ncbi:alpha beta hydrolase fold protein [Leptolyngbya sp. Heron Island J]|uniref:alpha/beta fold hydrolase n=1 Tax=Leptolyngbya sp. Heron Island J TaxID=1385935 RepID=UPI0003B961EA|nr:alpha/beta hydrolase [Leptolyngbya sp. Heron Island J]ESA36475.1 alpha beta hydrolase fold protein [Leptolyngbya sp. Heron Island J]
MLTQRIQLLTMATDRQHLPLLIFLPGMDGSDVSLRQQLNELKDTFDVRCFCLPGDDKTDWHGLVTHLVELVSIEKASRPHRSIYLCGESFGGCLALKTVCHSPDLFERLILINPASSFNRQIWSALGAFVVQRMPGAIYRFGAVGLLPFLISFERVSEDNRQALLQAMQQVTPDASAWRLSLLNEFQLNEMSLRQLQTPTLLVASVLDQLLPSVSEANRLAALLRNAQMITLERSGHACLLETNTSLYRLLDQHQFVPAIKL